MALYVMVSTCILLGEVLYSNNILKAFVSNDIS